MQVQVLQKLKTEFEASLRRLVKCWIKSKVKNEGWEWSSVVECSPDTQEALKSKRGREESRREKKRGDEREKRKERLSEPPSV